MINQDERYKLKDKTTVIQEDKTKEPKPLNRKAKVAILVVFGLLALAALVGLIVLIALKTNG